MIGLLSEIRNTRWGQAFQFHWPHSFWFCYASWNHVKGRPPWHLLSQWFEQLKGYVWLCANYPNTWVPLNILNLFCCYMLLYIRVPYPIQSTPISMPTIPETKKQSLLPHCKSPCFHQRYGTQIDTHLPRSGMYFGWPSGVGTPLWWKRLALGHELMDTKRSTVAKQLDQRKLLEIWYY